MVGFCVESGYGTQMKIVAVLNGVSEWGRYLLQKAELESRKILI